MFSLVSVYNSLHMLWVRGACMLPWYIGTWDLPPTPDTNWTPHRWPTLSPSPWTPHIGLSLCYGHLGVNTGNPVWLRTNPHPQFRHLVVAMKTCTLSNRAVHILLECILVLTVLSLSESVVRLYWKGNISFDYRISVSDRKKHFLFFYKITI